MGTVEGGREVRADEICPSSCGTGARLPVAVAGVVGGGGGGGWTPKAGVGREAIASSALLKPELCAGLASPLRSEGGRGEGLVEGEGLGLAKGAIMRLFGAGRG